MGPLSSNEVASNKVCFCSISSHKKVSGDVGVKITLQWGPGLRGTRTAAEGIRVISYMHTLT